MNKKRNNELLRKAEEALRKTEYVNILNNETIKDSYKGQTAALGVTIAMSGLRPALAIYQKKTDECDKLQILNAIAVMRGINQKEAGKKLFREVMECNDANKLNDYKRDIIDCSIALKQMIQTYKLVKR
jgi:CRISPR/Cas system CMR-associated protein Cmr5 small subunit